MNATELTQNWIKELERKGKSPHTIAAYRRALEHFITWNERVDDNGFNPAAIIPRDIEDWKAYQQTAQNASPAMANQRLVALSNFFQWALSEGLARSNPTAGSVEWVQRNVNRKRWTKLKAYLQEHPESDNFDARLWVGQRSTLNDHSAVGSTAHCSRILEKYTIPAQLSSIGPHVLRHTFSTRYLSANPGDLRGLSALLGHSSLDTVMIYTEPSVDDMARRMEKAEHGAQIE